MATVYDINGNTLVEEAAKELSKIDHLKPPEWAAFVRTAPSKERVPARQDWWYFRAASILRAIYKSKGPIGVQKLRIRYGSKKNRGHAPEKFYKASGKIIRLILQQLEKAELVKKGEKGVHKGRIISPKGSSMLDKIASRIADKKPENPKKKEKLEKEKAEKKQEKKEVKKEAKKTETAEK
ncbi:30S ribosomal protein S19e [Candidatus Woesearchaeota archaeon]|nr:30S ribosomal protein S19e [Candidatus Woesearchaeota archaeon]